MGDATAVKMGTCAVSFGGSDLGYTKGAVSASYSTESIEKTVDQEDTPIDELITKQIFEIKVPMAEYDLARFENIIPGATLTIATDKLRLDISGAAGGSLLSGAQELKIIPADGTANDAITLHHAVPVPSMEFAFEKENQRVYEVTFKALKGVNGWVTFGDTSVVVE